MIMIRSKKIFTLLGIASFVIFGLAAIQPKHGHPKNLKVLPKNISSDSLFMIMKMFEKSLGVTCNYCHIDDDLTGREDYASDSIPAKERCRNMMRMTTSINLKYFQHPGKKMVGVSTVVTCMTCHRGKTEPVSVVLQGK